MIQGGQPANGQTILPIQDEFTTTNHNYNGTIAMAKTIYQTVQPVNSS
jgi:cyclophilin family peptidyl-prolyl cis-trans isomerase